MHVLFLALSTFRIEEGKIQSSELFYNGESIGVYYYQMEPVFILLRTLNINIDKVYMLSTDETRIEKDFMIADRSYHSSEMEYFKNYIKNSIGEGIDIEHIEEGKTEVETVKSVICKLRECNKDKNIILTIDIHGGFRDTQMLIQSIITLLKYEMIEPESIYTVNYDVKHKKGIIEPANNTYDINKYVVGMSEFLSYGRAKTLDEYYSGSDREFIDIVKEISDAIQLCHVRKFDDAIKKMTEYVHGYKDKGSYDDIFIDSINASYGLLMDKKGRNKVVNKVQWCMNNDFIQQALTIIESQMPNELMQRKIIEYKTDHNKEVDLFVKQSNGRYQRLNRKINLMEAIEYKKPRWESEINHALIIWIRDNCCEKRFERGKSWYVEIMGIEGTNMDYYIDYPVDNISLQTPSMIPINNIGEFAELMFDVNENLNTEGRKMLARLLMLHLALKGERNGSNHASGAERATLDEVKVGINAYIQLSEIILGKIERDIR